MSLDASEVLALAPDVAALVDELAASLRKDDDGKVRVTREEARRIGRRLVAVGRKVLAEAVD